MTNRESEPAQQGQPSPEEQTPQEGLRQLPINQFRDAQDKFYTGWVYGYFRQIGISNHEAFSLSEKAIRDARKNWDSAIPEVMMNTLDTLAIPIPTTSETQVFPEAAPAVKLDIALGKLAKRSGLSDEATERFKRDAWEIIHTFNSSEPEEEIPTFNATSEPRELL